MQLRTVNKAIAARGIDAELVHGEGYFYFVGSAVENADSTSVMVFRLNDLTLDQWMEELDSAIEESTKRQTERNNISKGELA